MIDIKELEKLVKIEAKNLKQHASKEELDRLNFELLIVTDKFKCIYGLMTGYCFSDRARDLVLLCTAKCFSNLEVSNCLMKDIPISIPSDRRIFTPMELYITITTAGNIRNIIDYLKNEIDVLGLYE